MAGSDDIITPPELAGSAYESTVRTKAAQLKDKLINQTIDDVHSWAKAVDVQRANQPSDPRGDQRPITEQEYNQYLSTIRNDYYDWVVPAFERFLSPDPDATNPMLDALNAIQNNFGGTADGTGKFSPTNAGLVHIGVALNDMTQWSGALRENFVDNFLSPLETVAENERTVAAVARELLLINKINYIRYRRAVVKLLDTSINAVEHLANTKDPKKFMWGTIALAVVGTVLSAGSGAVLAIGTGLSVAATIAGGLTPDPPDQSDLAAPTAQEVAVNIANALGKLNSDTDTADTYVVHGLNEACSKISQWCSAGIASNMPGPLNVARPKLDSASPGDVVGPAFQPTAWDYSPAITGAPQAQ